MHPPSPCAAGPCACKSRHRPIFWLTFMRCLFSMAFDVAAHLFFLFFFPFFVLPVLGTALPRYRTRNTHTIFSFPPIYTQVQFFSQVLLRRMFSSRDRLSLAPPPEFVQFVVTAFSTIFPALPFFNFFLLFFSLCLFFCRRIRPDTFWPVLKLSFGELAPCFRPPVGPWFLFFLFFPGDQSDLHLCLFESVLHGWTDPPALLTERLHRSAPCRQFPHFIFFSLLFVCPLSAMMY